MYSFLWINGKTMLLFLCLKLLLCFPAVKCTVFLWINGKTTKLFLCLKHLQTLNSAIFRKFAKTRGFYLTLTVSLIWLCQTYRLIKGIFYPPHQLFAWYHVMISTTPVMWFISRDDIHYNRYLVDITLYTTNNLRSFPISYSNLHSLFTELYNVQESLLLRYRGIVQGISHNITIVWE